MGIKLIKIRTGQAFEIYAIAYPVEGEERDKCPVLAFFAEQSKDQRIELLKLGAILDQTAKNGLVKNEQKFKHLKGTNKLFEFKTTGGLRLLGFSDKGRLIICTHGFVKKSQKTPPTEIERAEKMKAEYLKAKDQGDLMI